MRSTLALAIVLSLGATAFWTGTDGLRAFTAEQARRLAVQEHPQPVPAIALEDQYGNRFSLSDLHGKRVLVEFIYTRCRSICLALGTAFQQIRTRLVEARTGKNVMLLSISFDPRDQRTALAAHARMYRADPKTWIFARAANPADLPVLLHAFGITVVRTPDGEFDHNAAIHLVDAEGRLARIFDYDRPDQVLTELTRS